MQGGFETQLKSNHEFFDRLKLHPTGSKTAVDLGAGCGFQSIPLSERGFNVTAIDLDQKLLDELRANDTTDRVVTHCDDLLHFSQHVESHCELTVCMTDTLLHLPTKADVSRLLCDVYQQLEKSGQFVLTFRDMSFELTDLDRFIPVKQDSQTIFTCFLEYEQEQVKVHDLVYTSVAGTWELKKSFYRKLRLSPDWVESQLRAAGFTGVDLQVTNGLVTVVSRKS